MEKQPSIRIYDLPKRLLLRDMADKGCIHNGIINFEDSCCWHCELSYECFSMLKIIHDERNRPMSSMSGETLVNFLKASIHYVSYKIYLQHHDRQNCTCELCQWLKEAEQVLSEIHH